MSNVARIWLREGRLFIRDGWFDAEGGVRTFLSGGEFTITDGWLVRGPMEQPLGERRSGLDRRQNVEGADDH